MQLSVNDELTWDNGTPFPEPCIDRIADTVGKVGPFTIGIEYIFTHTYLCLSFFFCLQLYICKSIYVYNLLAVGLYGDWYDYFVF